MISSFVDGGCRFMPLKNAPRPLLGANGGLVLTALDTENDHGKVAIKLFRNECDRDAVVQLLKKLSDALYMITFADPDNRSACIFNATGQQFPETPYAVAVQYARKSLEDVLSSLGKLEVQKVVSTMLDILRAVVYMHSHGWVHGDLKPSNILLEETTLSYKLDVFVYSSKHGMALKDMTPVICPPEVADKLANEQDAKATLAVDSWSLGCLLYRLLTGEELVHSLVPGADQLAHDRRALLEAIAKVEQAQVDQLFECIINASPIALVKNACSLLRKLLQVDPAKRLTTSEAQKHAFFMGGITYTYDPSAQLINGVQELLCTSREINAGVDLLLTRTHKLPDLGHMLDAALLKLDVLRTLNLEIVNKECPRTFVIMPADDTPAGRGATEGGVAARAKAWMSSLASILTAPPSENAVVSVIESFAAHHFRLYLVCELTGERLGEGYPITKPKKWVAKMMPAMMVGFKLLALANNASAVFSHLLVPGMHRTALPAGFMAVTAQVLDALSKKSSAEDFACVHDALLKKEQAESVQQVGASLRAFHSFLQKADPQREWAGLQRYVNDKGEVLWVSPDAPKQYREGS